MNRGLIVATILGAIGSAQFALPQQTAAPVISALQTSLAAMVGQTSIKDVVLTGTAEVVEGSNRETAPFVFKAITGGSSRIDLNLSSGSRSEVRINADSGPTGTWKGRDGIQHPISQHNLMTDSTWFFPVLVLSRMIGDKTWTVNFVGNEGSLLHFQTYQQIAGGEAANITPTVRHLTQMDFYLDAKTLLPAKFAFNIHPDSDARVDIPVIVQLKSYQTTNGVTLPYHVQKYVNNGLVLDYQIQTASFNNGLTTATLSAQ